MATRSRRRRVAKDHQFLIVDQSRQQYVFHDGAAIASRPIRPHTLSRVLSFYEDYLGWPVYDLSDTDAEDPMPTTPLYQNLEWATTLAAINHDPSVKVHAATLSALLKRGYIHASPNGGLGLTPDGEAYLEASASAPKPEMLRWPALDADAPPDFASPVFENGRSQASAIRAGVDEAVREHANGNGNRAKKVLRELAVRAQDQIEQHIAAQPQPVAPRQSAMTTLRNSVYDYLESQIQRAAPDLLPIVRALRATE